MSIFYDCKLVRQQTREKAVMSQHAGRIFSLLGVLSMFKTAHTVVTHPDTGYTDWLTLLDKSVKYSTKLTCLEINGYLIKVQFSVMISRTSNQARLKDLDAGIYCEQ
jgi:hypothetical protein